MRSVDDRLHAAFEETDPTWDHGTGPALTRVREQHRRERVRRAVVATTLAAAAVGVVATVAPLDEWLGSSSPVVGTPGGQRDVIDLEGTWSTRLLTTRDVRRTLDSSGFTSYTDNVLEALPDRPFHLDATFENGEVSLNTRTSAGVHEIDHEAFELVGNQLTLTPFPEVSSEYVVVDAERGTSFGLELLTTSEGSSDGVPGQVWQRVLWTSGTFRD